MIKNKSNNRGFVILYAVLVAGVISLGGVILANIITKQLILSSIGKESQIAYYAANAGDECARFGINQNKFGFFIGTEFLEPGENDRDLFCAESGYSGPTIESTGTSKVFTFETRESATSCSNVTVTINYLSNDGNGGEGQEVIVESKGKNICDNPNHPRLLEKVIYRSGV